MRKLLRKLWNDDRGNALIVAGAALPLLVGSAGLATDTIHWTLWKRELQRAADSAAIAGVYERLASKSTNNVTGVVDHDLELNHHTGEIGGVALAMESDYPKVDFPADDGDKVNQVHVELAVRKVLPFSSLFMSEAPEIHAEATAASVPGSDEFCVVSLEIHRHLDQRQRRHQHGLQLHEQFAVGELGLLQGQRRGLCQVRRGGRRHPGIDQLARRFVRPLFAGGDRPLR
jgi:hypothetical protein